MRYWGQFAWAADLAADRPDPNELGERCWVAGLIELAKQADVRPAVQLPVELQEPVICLSGRERQIGQQPSRTTVAVDERVDTYDDRVRGDS